MVDVGPILIAAIKSVGTAFLLFAWSAYFAWRGTIDKQLLGKLSYLSKVMFFPCITFQSISPLPADFFSEHWILILLGTVILTVGFVMGWLLASLLRVPQNVRPWFVLTIAIPNMNGLPLVIVEALCREDGSDLANVSECLDNGMAVLYTSTLSHNFIIWGIVYPWLESSLGQGPDQALEAVGLAQPSGGPVGEGGNAPEVAEEGPVKPSTLGATEGADGHQTVAETPETATSRSCSHRLLAFFLDNPPVLACFAAIAVTLAPKIQQLLYAPGAPASFLATCIIIVGHATPAVTSVIVGGSFGLQMQSIWQDRKSGLREAFNRRMACFGISGSSFCALVIGRILATPAVNFAIILACWDYLPADRWTRIILCFQPASVTANLVTVFAQLTHRSDAAELVAIVTLPQMALYVPTATCLIALGMAWSQGQ